MIGSIRVVFDPSRQANAVTGGTLKLVRLGAGKSQGALGSPKAATLTFLAAYMATAREASAKLEPFAKLTGQLVLRGSTRQPFFVLDPAASIQYLKQPPPDAPPPGEISLAYDKSSFDNSPPVGSELTKLRLPPLPAAEEFVELGLELEVAGALEAGVTTNDRLDISLKQQLVLATVSPCFAPGTAIFLDGDPAQRLAGEKCRIEYQLIDILKQFTALRLEVERKKQAGTLIAKLPLQAEAFTTGEHVFEWDGICTEGARAGQFVTALESPFVLRLVAEMPGGTRTMNGETEVVIQGLKLERAPYLDPAQPPAAGSNSFYQLRLTELGYHTGPIDGSVGNKSKRAIKDFQRAHPGLKPTGALDTYTKAYLDETAPPGTGLDHYQFILSYLGYGCGEIDGLNGKKTRRAIAQYRSDKGLGPGDVLDAATSAALDAEILPPLARVEVVEGDLRVIRALDNALPAPGAQKKVFIPCDSSVSPGSLPYNQKFKTEQDNLVRPHLPIEAVPLLKMSDGRLAFAPEATGPARINFNVDPVPPPATLGITNPITRTFVQGKMNLDGAQAATGFHSHHNRGGVRKNDDPGVFLAGTGLVPYSVTKDGVMHYAKCSQTTDRSRGRAGVFFVPSTIAGDRFAISAELDPEGFDTPPRSRPKVSSGTFEVWRRYRFCRLWFMEYVPKPHRTQSPQLGLPPWYESAFIEFVDPEPPTRVMVQPRAVPQDTLDLRLYTAIIREAGYSPRLLSDAQIQTRFAANILWPAPPAAIYNAHNEQAYYDSIDREIMDFEQRFSQTLRELSLLEAKPGLLVLVFDENAPQAGTLGVHAITNAQLQSWSWSLLASTGAVHLIHDQDTASATAIDGETLAHEIGHALWLHHASTQAGANPDPSDVPEHNSPEFQTCTMSYVALPNFCGKCVLKLRGWNEGKV